MDLKENFKNLSKDIQDIGKLAENLKNNSDVSAVELDFLKVRIHELYDSVVGISWQMKFDNLGDIVGDDKPADEQNMIVEETRERKETADERIVEEVETQDPGNEKEKVEFQEEKQEDIPSQPFSEVDEKTSVLSDKFQNRQNYRNEALRQEKPVQDIASKYHDQPIQDIAAAIGINEKFRYVRELFNGNTSLYNKTISSLNTMESEADAIRYLQDNFSWDLDEKMAKRLLDLTRRKLKTREND